MYTVAFECPFMYYFHDGGGELKNDKVKRVLALLVHRKLPEGGEACDRGYQASFYTPVIRSRNQKTMQTSPTLEDQDHFFPSWMPQAVCKFTKIFTATCHKMAGWGGVGVGDRCYSTKI